MLAAQLRGKMTPEEERKEDILTSNVFGSFKYCKPEDGLLMLLKEAVLPDGGRPLITLPPVCSCDYEFWPRLHSQNCMSCEPDVIIRLYHDDHSITIILVEAKYLSGKSSLPSDGGLPRDQLAKEWDNLQGLIKTEKADRGYLLYVTAHYVMPRTDIEEAQDELKRKRGQLGNMVWISWRSIPGLLENTVEPILIDLRKAMLNSLLDFFRGIRVSQNIPQTLSWCFVRDEKTFRWKIVLPVLNWGFQTNDHCFIFKTKQELPIWRFNK